MFRQSSYQDGRTVFRLIVQHQDFNRVKILSQKRQEAFANGESFVPGWNQN